MLILAGSSNHREAGDSGALGYYHTQFPHRGDDALKIAERDGTHEGMRRKRDTASSARAR